MSKTVKTSKTAEIVG